MSVPANLGKYRNFLRRHPWWAAAWLVALLASVVPLWLADMLPILDLPQHLATVRILRDLHTPQWHLDAFYALDLSHTQYLGWYVLATLLSWAVSIETAAKLLLTVYLLAWPLAFARFLRAHHRHPAFALVAVPFAWNGTLWLGYVNYLSALPLVFLWLALVQERLDKPAKNAAFALYLLPLAVYFLHAQAFLHALLLLALTALCHPAPWREKRKLAMYVLPAVLLFVAWSATSAVLANASSWQATRAGHNAPSTVFHYLPWSERFRQLPWTLSDIYPDLADAHILLALLGLATLGGLAGWLRARHLPDSTKLVWFPEVGFVVSLALYFAAPLQYRWIYSINSRTVPVALLLLLAVLARFRPPRAGLLVGLPAVALTLALCALHAERLPWFSLEAAPARRLLAQAPVGARGVGLIYNPMSQVATHRPFMHFAQWGVVDRGGMADFSFANFPQSPVVFVPPGPPQLPERFEKHPERLDMQTHGQYYDWFLMRDFGPDHPMPFAVNAGPRVRLVARDGLWTLWRRVQSPPVNLPGPPILDAVQGASRNRSESDLRGR